MFNTHKMVVRAAITAINEIAPHLESRDYSNVNWHLNDHFADGEIDEMTDALINDLDHFYREALRVDGLWF